MPPKTQNKKAEPSKPDDSGVQKNDVSFKFEFEIDQNNIQSILMIFEWFGGNSEAVERNETPLIENWQPKSSDDQRNVKFEKTFDAIRIDDEFAKTVCNKQFYIYFVNADDSKVIQTLFLDYSQLLSNKSPRPQFFYTNQTMKILEIEGFSLTVTADKELLTPQFKHYLNPLEVEIIGAKELPFQSEKNYLPIYAKYMFFDGTNVQTQNVSQAASCRWGSKHVFLLGLLDQTSLKEKFNSSSLKVEIHDRDEIIDEHLKEETKIFDFKAFLDDEEKKIKEKEEESAVQQGKVKGKAAPALKQGEKKEAPKDDKNKKKDAKKKDVKLGELTFEKEPVLNINSTNYGFATFLFIDFLKPHIRNLKLRAPIVPNKRFEDHEAKNLDLNTTARKELKKTIISSSYLDNGSFMVISIDLSNPIGSYVKPIKEEIEQPPVKISTKIQAVVDKKPPSREQKPTPSREGKPPSRELPPVQSLKKEDQEIYERAIYIFPYKSKEMVVNLQETINQINLEGLNIKEGGERALTTYVLSEEEKSNRKKDFISGFEILDDEFRMFILEGLSDKAMKKLEYACPRSEPNSNTFKILKNEQIKFKERIYSGFNVNLRKIRLRENLKDILINPNIYLRTKVPENIMLVLNQLNNIRKHWNLRTVVEFNLFPIAEDLISLERKYSDSLSEEDIKGFQMEIIKIKKKKAQEVNNLSSSKIEQSKLHSSKNTSKIEEKQILDKTEKNQTVEQNINNLQVINVQKKERKESKTMIDTNTLNQERTGRSPLVKQKTHMTEKYSIRKQKSLKHQETKEVYIYSSQPNNYYEQQLNELREKVRNDPHNFYTYSEKYLSLSIDPWTLEQQNKIENSLSLSKMKSPKAFRTITHKNLEDYKHHEKKPPTSVLEDLKDNPWHYQNNLKYQTLKPSRGLPIRDQEKKDFQNYIAKKAQYFSIPEVRSEDTLLNVEKERLAKEKKNEEKNLWKTKLKGTEYFYTFNKDIKKESQTDRYKGLLQNQPIKKGLLLPNNILENSKIHLTKALENVPSSVFHLEPWNDPSLFKSSLLMKKEKADDPANLHKYQFDFATCNDVLWKNSVAKPTKNSVF